MYFSRNTFVVNIYVALLKMFIVDIYFMRLLLNMFIVDMCCVMFKLFTIYKLKNDVIVYAEKKFFDRKNEFNRDCDLEKFFKIVLNSFLFINVFFENKLFDCQMHLIFLCLNFIIEFMIS